MKSPWKKSVLGLGLLLCTLLLVYPGQLLSQTLTQFWEHYRQNAFFDHDVYVNETLEVKGSATGMRSVILVTTDTTLTAAQCKGSVVMMNVNEDSGTTLTVTLPTAVAGYDVTFIDNDVRAATDLSIRAGTGDAINKGTAAKKYEHGNASTNQGAVRLLTGDATDWILGGTPSDSASWHNDNS